MSKFTGHAQLGKAGRPRRGRNPPKTQQWSGFQPHCEKSFTRCRPRRAGGKVRLCEQPGLLPGPPMVRVYEQALPARRWTERRRLSNVARGAAEGLEGPAGTERLDPTQTGHPDFPEAAAEARGPSVSFAATKLPFVTSRLRPSAVARSAARAVARTAASLGLLPFRQPSACFV